MVVRSAGLEGVVVLDELAGQGAGVGDDLLGVFLELGLGREEESGRDGGDGLRFRSDAVLDDY